MEGFKDSANPSRRVEQGYQAEMQSNIKHLIKKKFE